MKLSLKAVSRYRHLVILVQRRWRAYNLMWECRLELAERQFQRTQEVMLQQADRAHKGLPMMFRRKVALRKMARHINDTLAENKVKPIQHAPDQRAIQHVLMQHIKQRKATHLEKVFIYFEHRCEFLKVLRTTAPIERARALVLGTVDPTMSLEAFARERMHTRLENLEHPRYHPVIPIVEMAQLVHSAEVLHGGSNVEGQQDPCNVNAMLHDLGVH